MGAAGEVSVVLKWCHCCNKIHILWGVICRSLLVQGGCSPELTTENIQVPRSLIIWNSHTFLSPLSFLFFLVASLESG